MITAAFNGNYSLPVRATGESTPRNLSGEERSSVVQERLGGSAATYSATASASAQASQKAAIAQSAANPRRYSAQSKLPAFTALPGRLNKEQVAAFLEDSRQSPGFKLSQSAGAAEEAQPSNNATAIGGRELTEAEQKQVEDLKKIDRDVRNHEAQHEAAGGSLVRGKSFTYTKGPDGKRYVTGGEVRIDNAPIPDDPEGTIRKMQQVRRAALAPSDPSPQDLKVAAAASQTEASARAELQQQRLEEMNLEQNGDFAPDASAEPTETTPPRTPAPPKGSPFTSASSRRNPALMYTFADQIARQPRENVSRYFSRAM